MARQQGIPVLMYGHGGDELFCGYPWLQNAVDKEIAFQSTYNESKITSNTRPEIGYEALQSYIKTGDAPRIVQHIQIPLDFPDAQKNLDLVTTQHYKSKLMEQGHLSDPNWPCYYNGQLISPHLINSALISETYLRSNSIVQADRLCMRYSVESRLPLLDYKLVETVAAIMKKWGTDRSFDKTLWRSAMAKDIPEFVRQRSKAPFRPPVSSWFTVISRSYGPYLIDGELARRQILTPEALKLLSTRTSEHKVSMPMFFRAIVLEMWFRTLRKN